MAKPIIRWDHSGLEYTAKVLMLVNPLGFNSEEQLIDYIKLTSLNYVIDGEVEGIPPSMVGTGGWNVTFFKGERDDCHYTVEVSLDPYVMAKYLGLN